MLLFIQSHRRAAFLLAVLFTGLFGSLCGNAFAHPLGQFTINHFVRVETGSDRARIHYVVDLAELSAYKEIQTADTDQNGTLSPAEMTAYLDRVWQSYVAGLKLTADGVPVELKLSDKRIEQTPGTAGLMTMKLIFDLTGEWPVTPATNA